MKQEQEEISSLKSDRTLRYQRERQRRVQRLLPLLVFAAIGVLIAKQEIPAVDRWLGRLIDADGWAAVEACTAAAIATTSNPAFARLVERGRAEATSDGFYVSKVVVAELDSAGVQQRYRISCNVSSTGEVVAIGGGNGTVPGALKPDAGKDESSGVETADAQQP